MFGPPSLAQTPYATRRNVEGFTTLRDFHPVTGIPRKIAVDVDLGRDGVFRFFVFAIYAQGILPKGNVTLRQRTGRHRVTFPGSMVVVARGRLGAIPMHDKLIVHARTAAAAW